MQRGLGLATNVETVLSGLHRVIVGEEIRSEIGAEDIVEFAGDFSLERRGTNVIVPREAGIGDARNAGESGGDESDETIARAFAIDGIENIAG